MKVCLLISSLFAFLVSDSFTFQFNKNNSEIKIVLKDSILPEKNLISNGDFELGNTDFTSEYKYIIDTIYHGHYTVTSNVHEMNYRLTSPREGDHTTGRGNYLVIDSKIFRVGHKSKFWISKPVKIKPHTQYVFSAWAYHVGGTGSSSPSVSVTINDKTIGPQFSISDQKGKWQHIYYLWNSAKTRGWANVCMENIYQYQYVEDFAIDDIFFGIQ